MKASFVCFLSFILTAIPLFAQLGDPYCIDFENQNLGSLGGVGDSIIDSDIRITAQQVFDLDGNKLPYGGVSTASSGPLNSGTALVVGNAAAEFSYDCVTTLTFRISNQGGYLYFNVDGKQVSLPNDAASMSTLDGTTIDIAGGLVNNRFVGTVTLQNINQTIEGFSSLTVGGQELLIDDVCWIPCDSPNCFQFEEIPSGGNRDGKMILEDAGSFVVEIAPGASGEAGLFSGNNNQAGGLGSEALLVDSALNFSFGCADGAKLPFQSSGDVTIEINGESVTAETFAELDNTELGGVTILIPEGKVTENNESGLLCLNGKIDSLKIGGELLALDSLCITPCSPECIEFEGFTLDAKYFGKDTLEEDGIVMTVGDIQAQSATAIISDQNLSLGGGQELSLEDTRYDFGISCADEISFYYSQSSDGGVVDIGTASFQFQRLKDLDQTTIGGIVVDVYVAQSSSNGERGVITFSQKEIENFALTLRAGTIDLICYRPCESDLCIDFELEELGATFDENAILLEDGQRMRILGLGPNDGQGKIVGTGASAGIRHQLQLTDASLRLDLFGIPSMTIAYQAATVNSVRLSINGDSSPTNTNLAVLAGTELGGVAISFETGSNNTDGVMVLTGDIGTVVFGGTDLTLDRICRAPRPEGMFCIDFEGEAAGTTYPPFGIEQFMEDTMTIAFASYSATEIVDFDDRAAVIRGDTNFAGQSGNEIQLLGTELQFLQEQRCITDVSFHYGLSGTRSISIGTASGGQITDVFDMSTLDGQVIGVGDSAITIRVYEELTFPDNPSLQRGVIRLEGEISELRIASDGLFIDRFCYNDCEPPPFDGDDAVELLSFEPLTNGDLELVYLVTLREDDVSVINFRSTNNLALAFPIWNPVTYTSTPVSGMQNRYRVSAVVTPTQKEFFRLRTF